MDNKDLKYFNILLKKFNQRKANTEEIEFLEKYYNLFEDNEAFLDSQELQLQEKIKNDIKSNVDKEINLLSKKRTVQFFRSSYSKYIAAASILIVLSFVGYFAMKQPVYQLVSKTNDFAPGANKAILKLADGREILLDNAAKGAIVQLDGITIYKNKSGEIEYKIHANTATADIGYNTITTPNGGQYQILLHDGSRVWLNAGSSLTYPTAFKGKDRTVSITGEAYFEIAKNKDMPFKVTCGGQTVEVLGTHFNVNAYEDEDVIKTTLLEGAVKVSTEKVKVLMEPGEQIANSRLNGTIQKKTVDVEQEVAWRNGLFYFKGDDVKMIMRQIARWYDVEIAYDGTITDEKFYGAIARNSKLSEVFAILELNNVHFKSNGRKITVSSNN